MMNGNEQNRSEETLDNFLVNNQELDELSAILAEFNIFHVLKSEKSELKHSNVLAWLFDPKESHGLADIPLRKVLSNIILEASSGGPDISAAKIELIDLNDIEVRREWKNIDLLIIDRTNKLVTLIENKIYSKESPKQLEKYRNILKKEFQGFKQIRVFLTLMGDDTIDEESSYITYSYFQMVPVLESIMSQRGNQISEHVNIFLKQYLDVLRRLTMQNEELVKLCKDIYRKHKDAIDLINDYGAINVFQQTIEDFLGEKKDFKILHSSGSYIWYMPKNWLNIVPQNGTAWKRLKPNYSICCLYQMNSKSTMRFMFEMSAMDDADLRLVYANAFKKAGFTSLTQAAFKREAKYSRFHSLSKKIKDISDEEEMRSVAEELFNKSVDKFEEARKVLKKLWDK